MSEFDDYLSSVPSPQREELERIRKIVKDMVPDVEETISYAIPTFKYNKQYLLYIAAFKNHMSIYPTPGALESVGDKLDKFKRSKGTLQFTVENPIPDELIKEIIKNRLKSISKS